MSQTNGSLEGIAIIGMAGRFPQAANLEVFWDNLRHGREGISFFTDQELEAAGVVFPKDDPNYVKARGLLEGAELFDASFFGISPKEAEIMDPQHRVFLECAWEALEHAGCDPEREEGLIGVFASQSMNTYLPANLAAHPGLAELVGGYQLMLANDKDYLPTRVSYKLNLRGPSLNVQTGCSSSLVAVCLACQHLLTYQCDLALAGGVSITCPRKQGYRYQEGGILSPDGHCRAFDAKAGGTVAGEGAGLVVLKRLSQAAADGDQIYAVIKGFALNNDGSQKAGFTAPSEDGQAECIALAHAMAGVDPETIGYLEAHGTGTPLGDPIEVAGLTRAFRAGTSAAGFCALRSVKTNIGHLDAAAGIAGLISATLAMHHRQIPPSHHFERPNPKLELADSPFFINTNLLEWNQGSRPRRAGVSSFGIGGTNAHVVLEEAPAVAPSGDSRPARLIVLSAKTGAALEAATENLAAHLRRHPEENLADAAYTMQTGRRAFLHRRMVVCRETAEAAEALQTLDPKRVLTRVREPEEAEIVFMFPGQGTQRVNMGLELYRHEPVFREQVDLCAELLRPHLGLDLREILYPGEARAAAAREQLAQTSLTQPALFTIEYALAKLWMNWGIQPRAMIGHSLGEYTAACLAGVFSLKDALHLVAARGQLMQQQPSGKMLAVRMGETEAARFLNAQVSLAAVNSAELCVFSGPPDALTELQERLLEEGLACHRLETSHAFHSPMMEPVLGPFLGLVKKTGLKAPRIPYLSNVSGTWITDDQAANPVYWSHHLRQTVRFAAGMGELLKEPGRILIEAGPGQALSTFARQHPANRDDRLVLASLHHAQAQQTDVSVLLNALGQLWLAGAPIDWARFYAAEQRRRLPLPTYPFERKRYWVEPGRTVRTQAPPVETVIEMEASAEIPAVSSSGEREPESVRALVDTASPQGKMLAQLKELFSRLSGMAAETLDPAKTFVEMGFESLFLTQASHVIEKQFGARVPFTRLMDQYSTLNLLSDHLAQVAPARPGDSPATEPDQAEPAPSPSAPAAIPEEAFKTVPLTEAQREIWFVLQMGGDAERAFTQSVMIRMKGPLKVTAVCHAVQRLIDRHEALRTTFSAAGDTQQIHRQLTLGIPVEDLSLLPAALREEQYRAVLADMVHQPFDLVQGPLIRARLIKLETEEHALALAASHLVCDGGSIGVLIQELGEFYTAETRGEPGPAEIPQQYSQYTLEQQRVAQSPAREAAENYWLAVYSRPAPKLELPLDAPRPPARSFNGSNARALLGRELLRDLKRLSIQQRCTLFTTLLAGYALMLHRLSGQPEIIVGLPITGRAGEGSERLVGHCVNFVPLRLSLEGNPAFLEHLAQVRQVLLEAHDHQECTFGNLLQKLNLPRDPNRMPLVAVMFNMDWGQEDLAMPGLSAEVLPNPYCCSYFELSFSMSENQGELEAYCQYSSDLFKAETIQRWLRHFQTLLANLAAQPEQPIGKLSLLGAEERRQMLEDWSRTARPIPTELWAETNGRRCPEMRRGAPAQAPLYVLDAYLEPCPIGVPGEVYAGGSEAEAEGWQAALPRSIADPFHPGSGRRLFQTGGWARYLPDGQLELIDRGAEDQAPPAPAASRTEPEEIPAAAEAPFSATEEALAQIWREVIGLSEVGRHDNFFDLGGHSVLITQIISRARKSFGVELTLRHLFEAPTISELALIVENQLMQQLESLPESEAQRLAGRLEPATMQPWKG